MRRTVNGILLLNKPLGITSNAALQRVKYLFQAKKAGHTGSLDPLATGMLPICFGEATKFSQFLLDSDKVYDVTAQLGTMTTTGDREGTVTETKPVGTFSEEQLRQTLQTFMGEIEQIPPMFSALKVKGKPLYELARQGVEIERAPRRITVFAITFNHYDSDTQQLAFTVHCSKGTYVRTLVEDIGHALGTGAHVAALCRTSVTPYLDKTVYTFDDLQALYDTKGLSALDECLLPVETSVHPFPAVQLSTSAAYYLNLGQPVRATLTISSTYIRLYTEDGRFLGVGEATEDGRVKPYRLAAN